ncbi:MAG: T9SS type A sorting domain-containing protein [Chitinophagales bacterium]|nr:T9SS type A sorting domain-containing protein [Chitinophagales bacterium]
MKTPILSFLFQFLIFQIAYAQVWSPLQNGVQAKDSIFDKSTVLTLFSDTINLHIEASSLHNATVTILNLFGQAVMKQQFSDNASINISTLAKGIYLVNIMDERRNVLKAEKVLKE